MELDILYEVFASKPWDKPFPYGQREREQRFNGGLAEELSPRHDERQRHADHCRQHRRGGCDAQRQEQRLPQIVHWQFQFGEVKP